MARVWQRPNDRHANDEDQGVETDGSDLDLIGAFIRTVALGGAIACVLLGVMWAAFDDQKQG